MLTVYVLSAIGLTAAVVVVVSFNQNEDVSQVSEGRECGRVACVEVTKRDSSEIEVELRRERTAAFMQNLPSARAIKRRGTSPGQAAVSAYIPSLPPGSLKPAVKPETRQYEPPPLLEVLVDSL